MLYYYNCKDGKTVLDDHGVECASLGEARIEGIRATAEFLQHRLGDEVWMAEPWFLWVTDQPKGEGNTVLSLTCGAPRKNPALLIDIVLPIKKIDGEPDPGKKH